MRFRLSSYEWAVIAAAMAIESLAGMMIISTLTGQGMPGWLPVLLALAAGVPGVVVLMFLFSVLGRRANLERGDRLMNLLADTMVSPRILVDAEGRELWSNSVLRRRMTLDRTQPLKDLERRICIDDASRTRFRRAQESGVSGVAAEFEIVGRSPDGSLEEWQISVRPIPTERGSTLWVVRDITAQRAMQRKIRDEESKVVEFLEHAPVGFYSVDAEGRFLFANQTLAEWLGTTVGALTGGETRLHQFVEGPLPEGTQPHDPFGNAPDDHGGEVVLKGPDGRQFTTFIGQSVVRLGDGQLRTRSVVRDLTSERAMAMALARSEASFQRFFDEAPVGIALIDPEGAIGESNRAFRRMVGLGPADAKGKRLLDLVRAEDGPELSERLKRVAAGEGRIEGGAIEVRLTGGARPVVASVFASRLERGASGPPGVILHVLDVTDRKHLETQFAQSQKMQGVGQLAGGIAHDFNNLLTAMIGFCDLLLLRHRAGDPSFADIMQVKQNANRAASLVRQLLAFSRQQTLQPKVIDVTDALTELAHLLRRLIGEHIELKIVHGRDLHLVRVDQGQLEQVIINLAVNARDAMPSGGRLTIRTSNVSVVRVVERGSEEIPPGDYVIIEVVDTGIGIPKEIQGRIFEPFFSTKEVGSGTGLGLSTVYGIVRQTGGFVFVDSEPGHGASFSIYLPRWRGGRDATEADAGGAEPRKRDLTGAGTVLLVEDEDAVRLFSGRALRNKGYKVVEARTGEAALDILNTYDRNIDLLITDVVMPQMDGTALIKAVREQRPTMKVICISGYAEEAFRKRLDSATDVQFLAKPFTLDELAGKVKEVLGA